MSYRFLLNRYPFSLPSKGNIADLSDPRNCAQYKYNGTFSLMIRTGNRIRLIGKSGKNDYSKLFPDLVDSINERLSRWNYNVMCGEIVFIDEGYRDHFLSALTGPKVYEKYDLRPVFVVHDLIKTDSKFYFRTNYRDRYNMLESLMLSTDSFTNFYTCPTAWTGKAKAGLWSFVRKFNREGIVLKDVLSPIHNGITNSWKKVKNWRDGADITVIGITYGTGERRGTFGSVLLGELALNPLDSSTNRGWRYLGKCNVPLDKDREVLCQLLSPVLHLPIINQKKLPRNVKHYVAPNVKVEISHLGKTRDGMFWTPRFRRIRDDL